jgi:hypothetical protein
MRGTKTFAALKDARQPMWTLRLPEIVPAAWPAEKAEAGAQAAEGQVARLTFACQP